jgi:lysophospholipase L1-like esterase
MNKKRIRTKIRYTGGFLWVVCFITFYTLDAWSMPSQTPSFDTTRIYHAMAKARRGEPITVAVIGGSITNGYAASTEDKRWANLVASWWQTRFPSSTVSLVNAGVGATGSDIGAFRVKKDVIEKDPDFVVVEFAVNDAGLDNVYVRKMMEGILRQLLGDTSKTGVMLLLLKMENGGNAQDDHKIVGNYYQVPWVSQVDLIGPALAADGLTLRDVYFDNPGVHPNDLGMQYIADFIIEVLDSIYAHLPADEALQEVSTTLPEPLLTDVFTNTYTFTPATLIPSANNGWNTAALQWNSQTPGAELVFTLDGNAVAVKYDKVYTTNRGRAEVWIDDGPHKIIDAFFTETWGTKPCFELIADNLADGEHALHIKIMEEHDPLSSGNYVQLLSVYKAGHISTAPPIASPGTPIKTLTHNAVSLDGTASYDPDGDTVTAYQWTVVSAPAGSTADIPDNTADKTLFTPDLAGYYKIGLVVTGGSQQSVLQHLLIHAVASNALPVAFAGEDIMVATHKKVQLDGNGSYDADHDTLSFEWKFLSKPAESKASLVKAKTTAPYFVADVDGEFLITLMVNDSLANSMADTVKVTAIEGYSVLKELEMYENDVRIYPSPTHGTVIIKYRLDYSMPVTVRLFSPEGRMLGEPVNAVQEDGWQELNLNLEPYSSPGKILYLQLETGESIRRQKVIVY